MMRVRVTKELLGGVSTDKFALSGSFSFSEMMAMKARGEEAFYSLEYVSEIRRDGKTIVERGNRMLKQFKDYLEKETGEKLDFQEDYANAKNCVSLFEQVKEKLDGKSYEIVYDTEPGSRILKDIPYEEVAGSELYKKLRKMILVDGMKQIELSAGPDRDAQVVAKTAIRLANELGNIGCVDNFNVTECCEVVSFHPGYTYETFMEKTENLRASKESVRHDALNQTSKLVRIDGVLKEFCNFAALCPKKPFVLVIDNFDSVNLQEVFGEALTCLYPEYRGGMIKVRTMLQSYSWFNNTDNKRNRDMFEEGFYIPTNVIIIGIDRSSRNLTVPAGTFELLQLD